MAPDVVFIEAREEYFQEYNVVDGPIDMNAFYRQQMEYCKLFEENILYKE